MPPAESDRPLLELRDVHKQFAARGAIFTSGGPKVLRAVDGLSLDVARGETLGLVGETGCGKSTTARLIARLLKPDAGEVVFDGQEIGQLSNREFKPLRTRIQMVFQDPLDSLNPRQEVGTIVATPLRLHGSAKPAARARVQELFELVGLSRLHLARFPHELSGGQRQRVGIARALATEPDLIVCDEPVSALDVSVQAQVINLLEDLQQQLGLTYVFIGHDLAVVRQICDRIAVMYLGRIVEVADRDSLYERPQHPYTQALLSSAPIPDPELQQSRRRRKLAGEPPSPTDPPPGCRFHPRCWKAQEICRTVEPPPIEIAGSEQVACHFPEERFPSEQPPTESEQLEAQAAASPEAG
jgi:peptide/nickel transport system ATP-binding protein/oligopeptide transport system ATP-binding protein